MMDSYKTARFALCAAAALVALTAGLACSDDDAPAGCTADDQCRGGRVCIAGGCQDAPDTGMPADVGDDADDRPDVGRDAPPPDLPDTVDAPDAQPDVGDDADGPDADTSEDVLDAEDAPDAEPDLPDTPGALAIDPEAVDFGEVGLFVSAFREVTLRNTGGGDLTVSSVRLQTQNSTGFQLIAPARLPLVIRGGQAATWQVRFQPTQLRGDRPTRYGNFLLVRASDEETDREVPLEGLAVPDPAVCLTFDETSVDLGYVSPNNVQSARLALRNCGSESLTVETVVAEDVPESLVTLGMSVPFALAAGESVPVVVTYTPTQVREVRGRLVANAGQGRAVVEVLSGPECPTATALGRSGDEEAADRVGLVLGSHVTLTGLTSSDPTDGEITYAWNIQAPDGSTELGVDPGLDAGVVRFVPDVVGTYRASLRVISQRSGLESCNESVVFIDAFPDTPQVEIAVTWNNRADLDLHMVREVDGRFPGFGAGQQVQPDDCYFNNANPNWGQSTSRVDDPRLLGDDTDGEGPEQILYPLLDPSRRLRVGVNYARRRETQTVEATLVVLVNGEEAGRYTQTLTEQGAYWIPVIIHGDGTLTEP